jgi:hypothetical protein
MASGELTRVLGVLLRRDGLDYSGTGAHLRECLLVEGAR